MQRALILIVMAVMAMLAVALVPTACGHVDNGPTEAPAAASPTPGPSFIPTQAQLDQFRAEGPDPTLRKLSVTDYWLHYKLMQVSGIEKELGGEAKALDALQALGNAYEAR